MKSTPNKNNGPAKKELGLILEDEVTIAASKDAFFIQSQWFEKIDP